MSSTDLQSEHPAFKDPTPENIDAFRDRVFEVVDSSSTGSQFQIAALFSDDFDASCRVIEMEPDRVVVEFLSSRGRVVHTFNRSSEVGEEAAE